MKHIITRCWAMPDKNTFSIKPIRQLIDKYYHPNSIDPFANTNTIAKITNDIDPIYKTNHNLDAIDFLKMFDNKSVDLVLYDPPYSPRQVSEVYTKMGKTVNMKMTQSSFWGDHKKQISRIVCDGGYVISFGWNSSGIGKTLGFKLVEILLVAHGGWHNDTIVTVEQKVCRNNQTTLV